MPLSTEDKIELILIVGDGYCSMRKARDIFQARHPDKTVDQRTISRLLEKFKTTGNVADAPRSGRPRTSTDDENTLFTLATISKSPIKSQRKVAAEVGISQRAVNRILKSHKFHPYKLQLTHGLNEEDYGLRMNFAMETFERVENNELSVSNIAFGDEAIFHLNGHVNRQNCRFYAESNPHWSQEMHFQHDPRIMVWCGILGQRLIGPFFFHDTVDGETYLQMLQQNIIPAIRNAMDLNDVWFMQDGAPAHYARKVREYLNEIFPNHWIGRAGPLPWPARSPDLTPLDYFLWGHLKSVVYNNRPRTIEQLQENIMNECGRVTPTHLANVLRAFTMRLQHCIAADSKQFEHLID